MLVLSSNNDCPCKNDCLGIFKSSTYTKPNRTHNITQLTSCVHGPRNKFGDKAYLQMLDSQCYRLRVTSHIRLKAHDHCNVRAHIGQKRWPHTNFIRPTSKRWPHTNFGRPWFLFLFFSICHISGHVSW